MSEDREMPRYLCHKEVQALEIASVRSSGLGMYATFAEEGWPERYLRAELIARHKPVPGDFLVVYKDGYESISPGDVFREGYTRIG